MTEGFSFPYVPRKEKNEQSNCSKSQVQASFSLTRWSSLTVSTSIRSNLAVVDVVGEASGQRSHMINFKSNQVA